MPSQDMQARLQFEQGRNSFGAQDYGTAADLFKRAVNIDPQFKEAHRHLAACYERLGYTTRACRAWEALLRIADSEEEKAEITGRIRELK